MKHEEDEQKHDHDEQRDHDQWLRREYEKWLETDEYDNYRATD
jgi:hypothetical protein